MAKTTYYQPIMVFDLTRALCSISPGLPEPRRVGGSPYVWAVSAPEEALLSLVVGVLMPSLLDSAAWILSHGTAARFPASRHGLSGVL
jgi:hypothetical protein